MASASATTIPWLTEKTPPEIRAEILMYLLKFDSPVKPAANLQSNAFSKLDLSIFTANKLIYLEARDAFYKLNIIRAYWVEEPNREADSELLSFLVETGLMAPLVRNLEIVLARKDIDSFASAAAKVPDVLKKLLQAANVIQKITFCSDVIGHNSFSVRYLLDFLGIANGVRCVDIGLYQLGGNLSKVYFRHHELTKKWAEAKAVPVSVDHNAIIRATKVAVRTNDALATLVLKMQMATHHNLPLWLKLFDEAEWFERNKDAVGMAAAGTETKRRGIIGLVFLATINEENFPDMKLCPSILPVTLRRLDEHSDGAMLELVTETMVRGVFGPGEKVEGEGYPDEHEDEDVAESEEDDIEPDEDVD